ncbi:MAG: hypothetical protein JSR82_05755 [Verrucomicrobia bacterium]|nr:hypothetical protein [Verrucomicrobiota bacterium]
MKPAKRLLIPLATRGNIGKSTVASALGQWFHHHSIDWCGIDADADHRSFIRLFPDEVEACVIGDEPVGDIMRVLRLSAEKELTIIDPRAHLAGEFLRTLDATKFTAHFASVGGRITVLLFPIDDLEVMTDLDASVAALGDSVDYVVVKNRARAPRTRMYDGSDLENELIRLGAVEVELSVLLSVARNHIALREADLQRGITLVEACTNADLAIDPLIKFALQDWIRTLFRRFDAVAGHLLPEHLLARIESLSSVPVKVIQRAKRGGRINAQNL